MKRGNCFSQGAAMVRQDAANAVEHAGLMVGFNPELKPALILPLVSSQTGAGQQ
jgi:hypothetical protein